jgi:hypothetical protein
MEGYRPGAGKGKKHDVPVRKAQLILREDEKTQKK